MLLYEFHYTLADTDFEGFVAMMRQKHPLIIGRKRFCCRFDEVTEELRKDIAEYGVVLEEIK